MRPKRPRLKRLCKILAIGLLVGVVVCLLAVVLMVLDSRYPPADAARAFLIALLEDRPEAQSYLSTTAQAAARETCPGGNITGCAQALIPASWGEFKSVTPVFGTHRPEGAQSILFHTWWRNPYQPVSIVIVVRQEADQWVVLGWRGFVRSAGENEDGRLVRGYTHDNEFLPGA